MLQLKRCQQVFSGQTERIKQLLPKRNYLICSVQQCSVSVHTYGHFNYPHLWGSLSRYMYQNKKLTLSFSDFNILFRFTLYNLSFVSWLHLCFQSLLTFSTKSPEEKLTPTSKQVCFSHSWYTLHCLSARISLSSRTYLWEKILHDLKWK